MKCPKVHNKLIFFLEKELSDAEMTAVQTHLNECPECASWANELRQTLGVLENDKAPVTDPFFYTRVKAKIARYEEPAMNRKAAWVAVLQPLAFSALLLLGVYAGFRFGARSAVPESVFSAQQEILPYVNEMEAEPLETFLMQ